MIRTGIAAILAGLGLASCQFVPVPSDREFGTARDMGGTDLSPSSDADASAVVDTGVSTSADMGELADGGEQPDVPVPQPERPQFSQIATGRSFTCALRVDNTGVYCWGSNEHGILGAIARIDSVSRPVLARVIPGATQLAAGADHACVLVGGAGASNPSVVHCWGRNDQDQLGTNVDSTGLSRVEVQGSNSPSLFAMAHQTCVDDGAVVQCWGGNASGEIDSDSPATSFSTPRVIAVMGAPLQPDRLAFSSVVGHVAYVDGSDLGLFGAPTTIAQDPNNGTVRALLKDAPLDYFAVGAGGVMAVFPSNTASGSMTPFVGSEFLPIFGEDPIPLPGEMEEIRGGTDHFCARFLDQRLYCAGDNRLGQLGVEQVVTSSAEFLDTGLRGLAAEGLTVGDRRACTLGEDKHGLCWGNNEHGALGVGDEIVRLRPTPVLPPVLAP